MKFETLKICNWMAYKGNQELRFPTDDTVNILLIYGENMHGKTSLLNAVRWGLYGKALDRQKRLIDPRKIINSDAFSKGEDVFSVELFFTANKQSYQLKRICTLKTNGSQNDEFCELKIDGRVIDGGKINAIIEQLIPEQISNFMLFDGELLAEFEQLVTEYGNSQAAAIKRNIEKALGIPVFQRAISELQKSKKTLSEERKKLLSKNAQIQNLSSQLNVYERDYDLAEEEIATLEAQSLECKVKVEELEKTLTNKTNEIILIEKRVALKNREDDLNSEISEIKANLTASNVNFWKYILSVSLEENKKEIQENLSVVQARKNDIVSKTSQLGKLKISLKNEVCNVCGHRLSIEEKKAVEEEIQNIENDLADFNELDEQIFSLQNKAHSISKLDQNDYSTSQVDFFITQIREKEKELMKCANELLDINSDLENSDDEDIASTQRMLKIRNREQGSIDEKIQDKLAVLEKTDLAIKQIKQHPEFKKATAGDEVSLETQLCEDILSCFIDASAAYRDSMRSNIEERASNTFSKLTTEPEFERLELNENYGLHLFSGGTEVSRSAGAEQIIALSLIESINHLGRMKGPMLMDTPSGRLDLKHRANVMNYLPSVVTQLAFFAHTGELRQDDDFFDRSKVGRTYRINRKSTFHSELEEI